MAILGFITIIKNVLKETAMDSFIKTAGVLLYVVEIRVVMVCITNV